MPRYNSIHRQQLFHWIGQHIDGQHNDGAANGARSRRLTDAQRDEYVACLEGALAKGLWVKTPRVPDQLGDGKVVVVTRPIVCFTEWSLDESLPHTTRYGRLGLGFAKSFVSGNGGQPVAYVRDHRRGDPFTRALLDLVRAFREGTLGTGPSVDALAEQLDYLAHFCKRNSAKAPPRRRAARRKKTGAPASRRLVAAVRSAPNPYARRFGRILQYLEEREWRIVHDASLRNLRPGPGSRSGGPDHYLPFECGRELFTVVLPDNGTLHRVMHSTKLRRRLLPANAPHVTVLSLEDIGTF